MYAATTLANKGGMDGLSAHSRLRKWKDVDVAEMKAFLAILLLMGVDRRPSYDMYWTTEWTIQHQEPNPSCPVIVSTPAYYRWAIPCKQGHGPQKSNSFLNFIFIFKLLLIDVRTRM